MDENTRNVSKLVREFHKELGGAILIEDLVERGEENDITEEQILEALDELEEDGIISKIDDETIEFM